MAKSKIRRKSKNASKASSKAAAPVKSGASKSSMIKIGVVAGLVVAGGWWWLESSRTGDEFQALVRQGADTLSRVDRVANQGTSGHLAPGERIDYGTNMPTSGRHDSRPVTPGFYGTVQSPTMIVHSLEHGMVVVYYDKLSEENIETLKDWSGLFGGPFSGMVVTRQPGLGEGLMLTAWQKSLAMDSFDAAAAASFIDAYRGRGPENPMR